jgi:SHS2 domain-containing protein
MHKREGMSPFRVVDHTADIAVDIWGKDVQEFINEGVRALFFLLTEEEIENIDYNSTPLRKRIKIDLSDFDEGYIDFINRIITFVDIYDILAVGVDVHIRANKAFTTVYFMRDCSGFIKREIKAATRHNFKVSRNDGGLKSRITFDI